MNWLQIIQFLAGVFVGYLLVKVVVLLWLRR